MYHHKFEQGLFNLNQTCPDKSSHGTNMKKEKKERAKFMDLCIPIHGGNTLPPNMLVHHYEHNSSNQSFHKKGV